MAGRGRAADAGTGISKKALGEALAASGGANSKSVLNNPKLYKSTFDLLKEVEKGMSSGVTAKTFSGSASAVASLANVGVESSNASVETKSAVRGAAFLAGEVNVTMGLVMATRLTTVGGVMAVAGATVVQKTGLAVSLAGGDDERAKCVGAVMELAGSATITGIGLATLPVSNIGAVLAVASTAASIINTYNACAPLARR